MDFRLPIPNNWQDFESICLQLWKEIWNDHNAEKNGRQGQTQNGIDIFGTPIYSKQFSGVQCKDKNGILGSTLKASELYIECKNAEKFKPNISSFTLATTSARDSSIQEIARNLTDKNKYNFTVQIWSWDEIQSEIAYRPLILNHYYSGIVLPMEEQMKIILNRFSPKEQFYAFFSRPSVANIISNQLKDLLIALAYELSDNSYKHGNATTFHIIVENKCIVFKDNGKKFNPLKELNSRAVCAKNNVGSFVLETFLNHSKGIITPKYCHKFENDIYLNCLEFEFSGDISLLDNKNFIELYLDLNDAGGRAAARKKALSINIPSEIKDIILTITLNYAISASFEFIRVILEKLNENQKLILSLPRSIMFMNFEEMFGHNEKLIVQQR